MTEDLELQPMRPPFLFTAMVALLTTALLDPNMAMAQRGTTTVYVVRHAEKLDPGAPDSFLSPAGEARARALWEALRGSGVERIYATIKARTQQTVAVVAAERDLEIIALLPDAIEDLVDFIRTDDKGKVVLVCGHSNTVPGIVKALSGITVDGLTEDQYDRLFKVDIPPDGEPQVTVLRYGDPTP